jgi:hypothetical protein
MPAKMKPYGETEDVAWVHMPHRDMHIYVASFVEPSGKLRVFTRPYIAGDEIPYPYPTEIDDTWTEIRIPDDVQQS